MTTKLVSNESFQDNLHSSEINRRRQTLVSGIKNRGKKRWNEVLIYLEKLRNAERGHAEKEENNNDRQRSENRET